MFGWVGDIAKSGWQWTGWVADKAIFTPAEWGATMLDMTGITNNALKYTREGREGMAVFFARENVVQAAENVAGIEATGDLTRLAEKMGVPNWIAEPLLNNGLVLWVVKELVGLITSFATNILAKIPGCSGIADWITSSLDGGKDVANTGNGGTTLAKDEQTVDYTKLSPDHTPVQNIKTPARIPA